MFKSDDEQSKREFYYYESKNNKNDNIENHAIRVYGMLFKKAIYIKPLINLDCLVITGKYQTSVFMYRPRLPARSVPSRPRSDIFP